MSTTPVELIKAAPTFDGILSQYTHQSSEVKTPMRFSVFVPNSASKTNPSNVLFWLSGLTCTDENFCMKAQQAFEAAGETNMVIVISDTSPRGANCLNDKVDWDFGEGAGFYLNSTTAEYKEHYRMKAYVTEELYTVVQGLLGDVITNKRAISGHSMGGLGALNLYLQTGLYKSCSAFAPISNPINCPWGQKAFTNYLGKYEDNEAAWKEHDPTCNIKNAVEKGTIDPKVTIKIEQGLEDKFYKDTPLQLLPEALLAAAKEAGVTIDYTAHEGLDHSYTFVSQFIADHVRFHAKQLQQ